MTKSSTRPARHDEGFTLIEILIAIVVVGILSAVAVVGISSLTSKGNNSACTASADAAKAATVVYYASNNKYPITLDLLTTGAAAPLVLPTGVTVATGAKVTAGATWTLTMNVDGTNPLTVPPTFACS
ncbi:MAG: hypothetical protein RJA49_1149 [Actinomycetota bacterium]|jgi:prepilin-type N-terminal cleavage/methylation domain-containing protein